MPLSHLKHNILNNTLWKQRLIHKSTMYTHSHMHTHTLTCTYMYMHTHTHTHMDATTHFVVVAVVIANTGPSYNGYMGGIESVCAGIRDFADCF